MWRKVFNVNHRRFFRLIIYRNVKKSIQCKSQKILSFDYLQKCEEKYSVQITEEGGGGIEPQSLYLEEFLPE